MPCYDHRSSAEYKQKEIDRMARWLCSILGTLEASGIEMELQDPELKEWWKDHKDFDRERFFQQRNEK